MLAVTVIRSGRREAPVLRVLRFVSTFFTFLYSYGFRAQGVHQGFESSCTMTIARPSVAVTVPRILH